MINNRLVINENDLDKNKNKCKEIIYISCSITCVCMIFCLYFIHEIDNELNYNYTII